MRVRSIVLFALFFGLLALPVLLSPLPPLIGYPNHLARIHILTAGDGPLAQFYSVDWHLVPNLAMDLVASPLTYLFGIEAAGKIFLLLIFALVLSGALALSSAINGRLSVAAMMVAPLVYSTVLVHGMVNYLFGLGVALWGISCWARLKDAPLLKRAAISLLFVGLTYIGHLAACGVYGLGIAAFELSLLSRGEIRGWRAIAPRAAVLAGPFLPIPALLLLSPHPQTAQEAITWAFALKSEGIRFFIRSYWWSQERLAAGIALALLGLAYYAKWWRLSSPAFWLIVLSVPVYLLLPSTAMGSWAVDLRVPTGLALVLIGMMRWSFRVPRQELIFVTGALAFTFLRFVGVSLAWQDYDHAARDLRASLPQIPLGSRVLIARTDPEGDMPLAIQYMPCEAVIERQSLVSLVFSDPRAQIISVKHPFDAAAGGYNDDPMPVSELIHPPTVSRSAPRGYIYWRGWQNNYDFLYVLGEEHTPVSLPADLKQVAQGHLFRLYSIPHAPPPIQVSQRP